MDLFALLGLAVVVFATTDVDDLFILIGFFTDPRFRTRDILLGQYLGIGVLFLISAAGSSVSLFLDPPMVGLLGLLPMFIGIRELLQSNEGEEEDEHEVSPTPAAGKLLAVASVTIANGGDNIGVYTPFFATRTAFEIALIAAVFVVLTALWVWTARWLVSHPKAGAPLRRYGPRVVPYVLIALGIFIMAEAGTFALFIP